jgi:hypothetical protein
MINPSVCDICGGKVASESDIVLPATEYAELLKTAISFSVTSSMAQDVWVTTRSPIGKNPSLAVFIFEVVRTMTYNEIIAFTKDNFGLKSGLTTS